MHPDTLFHLVPNNKVASSALLHPDNKHLVSNSSVNDEPGLEVGYHATSVPRGHVIARLGRDADLILSEGSSDLPMSGIHIAFEINPATQVILLSVRSKRTSSVTFSMKTPEDKINGKNKGKDKQKDKEITGDGVIAYTQDYNISIASYHFTLVWRRIHRKELEAIAVEGYEESVKRCQQMLVSRRRPTEAGISEAQTWHLTRLNVAHPIFQDVIQLRTKLGQGSYGKVYKAIDQTTGHAFAIKVVDLQASDNPNAARTLLHREVETMERLRHKNIIELLGYQSMHTLQPEIHMPLCDGSLTKLAKSLESDPNENLDKICSVIMEHMLGALDYLACENLIHRDVKPDNILFKKFGDDYLFQLADFGLTNHQSQAKTICGTRYYCAPELAPHITGIHANQSPKMDIWSLCATMFAVRSGFTVFPPATNDYSVIVEQIRTNAANTRLEPMARLHPDLRASAAQMLVHLFGGKGMTTAPSSVVPIKFNSEYSSKMKSSQRPKMTTVDPIKTAVDVSNVTPHN